MIFLHYASVRKRFMTFCEREGETRISCVVCQYVVVTVCAKAGLIINSWTWVTHLATWGSIILWFLFIFIYR